VLLMDKTGTITVGAARVADVLPFGGRASNDLVRLAASLDQMSSHVFAPAIVREARSRVLTLSVPRDVVESAGLGVEGPVDGSRVSIGKGTWVTREAQGGEEMARVRARCDRE